MPSLRGIFRLKQVYEEQLSGNWSIKPDVWLSPSPFFGSWDYGYFGGGYGGPGGNPENSTVDRIDYSNDTATASVRGPLTASRLYHAASSSVENGLPSSVFTPAPPGGLTNFGTGAVVSLNTGYLVVVLLQEHQQ